MGIRKDKAKALFPLWLMAGLYSDPMMESGSVKEDRSANNIESKVRLERSRSGKHFVRRHVKKNTR